MFSDRVFKTLLVTLAMARVLQTICLLYIASIHKTRKPPANWAVGSTIMAIGMTGIALLDYFICMSSLRPSHLYEIVPAGIRSLKRWQRHLVSSIPIPSRNLASHYPVQPSGCRV